jgi:uncharacterized protein YybS (DUF2232 family)
MIALVLIGITFLSAPSAGGDGSLQLSETEVILRRFIYIVIVSGIFAFLAYIIGYLFRTSIKITKKGLKKIFIYDFLFFILVFLLSYLYIYLIKGPLM